MCVRGKKGSQSWTEEVKEAAEKSRNCKKILQRNVMEEVRRWERKYRGTKMVVKSFVREAGRVDEDNRAKTYCGKKLKEIWGRKERH